MYQGCPECILDIVIVTTYNSICCAEVAQVVEQRTENPRVDGSTPPLGTIFPPEWRNR